MPDRILATEEQHAYALTGLLRGLPMQLKEKTVHEMEMMRLPLVPRRRENPLFMGYNFLRR